MNRIVPVEDILFVFGKWTLMVSTSELDGLTLGSQLWLFDEGSSQIGVAAVQKFLPSRNPKIQPVEITPISCPSDFKLVKYFSLAQDRG